MPVVVVDTNILMQNYLLDNAHVLQLFIGCRQCALPVYIPAVVQDELIGNHAKDVRTGQEKLSLEIKGLKKRGVEVSVPKIDIAAESTSYTEHVESVKAKHGINTAAYPNVSLSDLVSAPYGQRKPFKASGEGHKDYLVFRTILELIGQAGENVYFLTNNTSDFCNKKKELHPDLAAQVPQGREVRVFTSINSFYEEILAPELKALEQFDDPDAVLAAIKNDEMEGFVLKQSVETILIDELIEKAPTLDELEGPLNEPSAFTLCYFSIDEDSLEVGQLDKGVVTIALSGEAELELFGFIDKTEYFATADDDAEGVSIDNADWNDYVVSAYYTMPVTFTLTAVFNIAEHEVVSASVEVDRQDDHM